MMIKRKLFYVNFSAFAHWTGLLEHDRGERKCKFLLQKDRNPSCCTSPKLTVTCPVVNIPLNRRQNLKFPQNSV